MKNIWRILILRYVILVAAVAVLIVLPFLLVPEVRHIWWIILCVLSLLIAVIIAVSVWMERTIIRDLRGFSDAASGLASGDLDRRVAESEIKEFADLARDFNVMAEEVRLRMEEAAMERGKLEAVLRNISTGVMVTDSERRIVMLNPAAEAILGTNSDKALGRRVIEVFSSRELDVTVADAAGGDSSDVEIEILYPQRMFLHVKSRPVTGSSGEVIATVSAIEDVTAIRRLDQVRQDFVANVSHELRTPAATIKALTDSLLGGALDERDTAARFVKDLGRESSRLAQLIEDLLTLGRLEAEGAAPKMEEFSLEELVSERLESKVKLAVEYEVTMDLVPGSESRKIKADRRLLGTAIDNLLDNAIKYNRPGGKVEVRCKYSEEGVTIRVEDNGMGIARDELPRVFERFYRVDKARSRETGGTGLGLSIVKHIAELHGGTVSVESVEDEGSTFSIHLFGR